MSKKNVDHTDIVRVLKTANTLAQDNEHEYTTLEHLLGAMLEEQDVLALFKALNVDAASIAETLEEYYQSGFIPSSNRSPVETETLQHVIQQTVAQVYFSARDKAEVQDLLVSILQRDDSYAASFLKEHGLDLLALKQYLSHGQPADQGNGSRPRQGGPGGMGQEPQPTIESKEDAVKFLEKFSKNLNEVAATGKIDPVIGREDEVLDIIRITARRTKNNSVLVGEPGVGKTAIAEGLAMKIVNKEVPDVLTDSVVYSLDISALVAGTKYRGDLEDRMKNILKAMSFLDGMPILFIDEIHMIMGAGSGSQGSMDVANMLKPALAKGNLRVIGSTTYDEYQKHFEKDRALLRRFQKIDVEEPTIANAKLIMRGLRSYYEEFHGVTYTDEALDQAVELTARFVQNRFLPDKAIDVIDGAGARQRIAPADQRITVIDKGLIELEVSKIARIPQQSVQQEESEKLMKLEDNLAENVFGQEPAIKTLTDAVYNSRGGLNEDNKPAGTFLFVGPTGVGKTEMARTLADTLGIPLLKYDMSEYMEKHSVAKLIGAPPGYVGHGEGGAGSGMLTSDIEKHPNAVLLLDEFEKAHPDVYNIFLQVFDDGRLTNSNGKTVQFNNVFIIMTSNAGASQMQRTELGFSPTGRKGEDDAIIAKSFTPEFRNRLDGIVKFSALKQENMLQVVEKFLARLASKAEQKGVKLKVTKEAKEWLAVKGYDPKMGARPLGRVITDQIKNKLSRMIVFKQVPKSGTVTVKVKNDELVLA